MEAIKVGDRLVVNGRPERAIVSDIIPIPVEARTAFILDWGPHGASKVYDHDEGNVWYRYSQVN